MEMSGTIVVASLGKPAFSGQPHLTEFYKTSKSFTGAPGFFQWK